MNHFVVKIFLASGGKGAMTARNQNPADVSVQCREVTDIITAPSVRKNILLEERQPRRSLISSDYPYTAGYTIRQCNSMK